MSSPRRETGDGLATDRVREPQHFDDDASDAAGSSDAGETNGAAPRRRHFDEDGDEDDEEEDDDDEEDDEEEDEEDEDGGSGAGPGSRPGQQRKRRKRRAGNRFLDVEAEVDEDEEDFEEEDEELAREDGFIEQEAVDEGDDARRRYAADNQRLDRLRREQEDKSAEQLAEELNERYRRTARYAAQSDFAEVPQRLLMPSVDDPKLWCVKCKIGRERDIVMTLMRKQDAMGGGLRFISAFCRDSLPGRMYVESRSAADVLYAVLDIVGCYARGESQLQMVPIGEMADLLKITKLQPTVKIGGWVRLKRGKYAGDLAQVIDQAENGEDVGIKFVPRIDMNPRDTGDTFIDKNGKKRKKNAMRGFADRGPRPQQRFFNPDEVRKVYAGSDRPVKRGDREWVFQKDTFRDGYCERDVRIDHLLLDDVKPSLDEVTKFTGATVAGKEGVDAATAAAAASGDASVPVDLEMLANAAKETSTTTLERDDAVEVFEGDLTGVQGSVQKISGNIITILFDDKDMLGQTAEVPARSVRKRFKPGDHVKVTTGKHQDETGLVVKTEDSFTTFLSDLTLSEVTVFSKDLRQATEVGSGVNDIAGYELHNLVQLDAQTAGVIFKIERESFRVLDQLGNVLTVRPHQISMKRDTGRAVALDNEGSEFRAGDKMKEVEGEHREGQVLHIYQSVLVFMHNRDVADNGGVFISRARQLIPVAPKSTAFGNAGAGMKGADLSKQNPQLTAGLANAAQLGGGGGAASSMKRMGRDPLQGKAVSIIKGPYKTYRGIIKDTNGPVARVELHTMAKILTIDLKFLVEKDPMTGKSRPLMGNGPSAGAGSMGPPGNMTGNPYAQPPRAGANPYSTPYGGMGGATPYGNSTPAYGAYGAGNKTPAYGGAGSGAKTPAYPSFDGSKTPAYGGFGGGKTPNPYASMDGGKTPAYGGYGGGGKTPNPYASMDGSKTPYAGDAGGAYGGATPAWRSDAAASNGVDSRRRFGDNPYASAGTPYGAAPTPGAYGAPTPGAYGSAPTPAVGGYGSAQTPGAIAGGGWGAPTPGGPALSAPTPGGPLSGPTPGAHGAPTPWGSAPSAPHYDGGLEGVDRPLAETLVRIEKDAREGQSYQGGRFDRSMGAVTATGPNGETATVQLDGGELLRDVPAKFISPQRPDRTGELCLVTMGPMRGRSAKVASVDANEFMVTLDDKSMHVLPPGALAKKA
ncbi:unnamed protein product [Parajaminaea phylloscopi]